MIVCVIVGTAINLAIILASKQIKIPMFIVSAGTVLISALGGSVPGIIVAFVTNLICGVFNSVYLYYSGINAIVAVAASLMGRRGWYKKGSGIALAIIVLMVTGGALGAALTNFAGMLSISGGGSSSLAELFFSTGKVSEDVAVFLANFTIDFVDKSFSVLFAAFALKVLPDSFIGKLRFTGWIQMPETSQDRKERLKVRLTSIRFKIAALIATASLLLSIGAVGSAYNLFRKNALEQNKKIGAEIARLAANEIDGDMIDTYFEKGESTEGYAETEKKLYDIYESTTDIQYIYVYQIREDGCHVVFDLDTPDLEGGNLGDFIDFDEAFKSYIPALLKGERIEPIISDETFGWLLTFYEPVYDSNGVCKAYAAADISMILLNSDSLLFLVQSVSMFLGFFIVILSIGLWIAENGISIPIKALDMASGDLSFESEEKRQASLDMIRKLQLDTGDEIENLYRTLLGTVENTVKYINESEHQAEVIKQMQSGLIILMADLVESRDKSTGDHIRKTAAYVRIIIDKLQEEGIYTDRLNDGYIDRVISLAPLHDIGKISVSDAILNKPGRLTDDEYSIMKRHTTEGYNILSNATDIVPETSYLDEAKNLAECHHERWDGKGYPKGLKGEEIPLSARIMAVADVFDALVSKRSYKAPFTFENAMQIIKDGAGTQFDPKIVKVFVDAEDEVRKISEEHSKRESFR